MTNDPPEPDIAVIRELLTAAFTVKQLRRFCSDHSVFRPVVVEFAPDHGLADIVDRVLEYCEKNILLEELLDEVKQHNPRQYARFFGPELPAVEIEEPQADQPAEPTPELALSASDRDTITSPPIKEDKKLPEEEPARPAAKVSTVTTAPVREIEIPPDDGPPELTLEIPTILGPIPLHLVRVLAGEFVMGGVLIRDRDAKENELPPHRVDLPEFHIGKYPVTNLQYHAFVQATGHPKPQHWEGPGVIPPSKEHHPVVYVSWRDAVAFCTWLSQETGQPVHLTTESEWEKAARGVDGRIYPWGDEPPDKDRCNFSNNVGDTTTIGRYSPQGDSPYGCAGMAGNVWEWCQSLYEPYPYQASDGREDLKASGNRVLRGGGLGSDSGRVRCAFRIRYDPDDRSIYYGFRVARGPLG